MNVYCYKLRFWGDNCSALLWPEITDEASAILVMLSSTLSPVTLSRLPGEGAICISVSPGYTRRENLPLPWVLWVQPLSEAADSLHSHSELDNHIQCWSTLCKVFSLPFLLCLASVVSHLAFAHGFLSQSFWYMCMPSLSCHEVNKRMTETDSLISTSLRRDEKEVCERVK